MERGDHTPYRQILELATHCVNCTEAILPLADDAPFEAFLRGHANRHHMFIQQLSKMLYPNMSSEQVFGMLSGLGERSYSNSHEAICACIQAEESLHDLLQGQLTQPTDADLSNVLGGHLHTLKATIKIFHAQAGHPEKPPARPENE